MEVNANSIRIGIGIGVGVGVENGMDIRLDTDTGSGVAVSRVLEFGSSALSHGMDGMIVNNRLNGARSQAKPVLAKGGVILYVGI